MKSNLLNRDFFKDKRVFITGHTGYKGAWLTAILSLFGASLGGYSLSSSPNSMFQKLAGDKLIKSYYGNLNDFDFLNQSIRNFKPEIIFHLGAQVSLNDCFNEPRNAFETNIMGTVNILEAIRKNNCVKSAVLITSDKVYLNKGDGAVYSESDPLGGIDPYSCSKTCIEYIVTTYRKSYFQQPEQTIGLSTIRASNVLGGGDYSSYRLIPSIMESIIKNKPVELRQPHQTRPWQSMFDALNGYMTVGRLMYQNPFKYSDQWNIGPNAEGIKEVLWVVKTMQKYYSETDYVIKDSYRVTESKTLGLDISKAKRELGWEPLLSCEEMIKYVVDYYKQEESGIPVGTIVEHQIRDYFEIQ